MVKNDSFQVYDLEPKEFYIKSEIELEGGNKLYELIPINENRICPLCGGIGKKHGQYKPREVRDLPVSLTQIGLRIYSNRFKCKECDNTWVNEYQSIDSDAKITNRMREYIRNKSLYVPFRRIAEELSISETTVKRIFQTYVEELESKRVLYAPEILGIDENHLMNNYRAVFVDVKERILLDIIPKRSKVEVKKFIQSLPEYKTIKVVTMDMWKPYRDAVYETIPDVVIVVDKFHVIKEVIATLENIRRRLNRLIDKEQRKYLRNSKYLMLSNKENLNQAQLQKLEELFKMFPQFERPYHLKEMLRGIYSQNTREAAIQWYEDIKDVVSEYTDLDDFLNVFDTIDHWYNEIFNYFDYQYTNAATENINKMINDIGDSGRGYSFEVLRAKAIFRKETKKPNKFEFPK